MTRTSNAVIMQPTTLCNMDCTYCYLPARKQLRTMPIEVAQAVSRAVEAWEPPVEIVWHGGEPLTLGRDALGALMDCFPGNVIHSLQTNATLVDSRWCQFLTERQVRVGVSLDGTAADNAARLDWAGRPTYDRAVRGIRRLGAAGLDVSVIAVVSDPTLERARRLYRTVAELGCTWLGVNIEEREGVNRRRTAPPFTQVQAFWSALAEAWHHDRSVQLRDVDRVLTHTGAVLDHADAAPDVVDPLPTIAHDGAVTLISPELAGFHSSRLGPFACGNVIRQPLSELIDQGMRRAWVAEYRDGIEQCRTSCVYFGFCGGAHPANRYFEHGRLDGTETDYCRNAKMALMEGVLDYAHRI